MHNQQAFEPKRLCHHHKLLAMGKKRIFISYRTIWYIFKIKITTYVGPVEKPRSY